MPEPNAVLREIKILDFQARIEPKNGSISLKTNISVQSKKPINKINSGMLSAQIIISAENKEEFYVSFTEELIFEFDSEPNDLDDFLSTHCKKMALHDMSERLDSILKLMGYPKLDFVSYLSE